MSAADKPAVRKVPCPTCAEPSVFEPFNPYRPFCSERCRLIDLGAWADEAYRVPGKPADDASGGSEEQDR